MADPRAIPSLLQFLIEQERITSEQAVKIARHAKDRDIPVTLHLTQSQMVPPEILGLEIARFAKLPFYDVNAHNLRILPEKFLQFDWISKKIALPLYRRGDTLLIGVIEPDLKELMNIAFLTQMNIEYVIVEARALANLLDTLEEQNALPQHDQNSQAFFDTITDAFSNEEDVEVETVEHHEEVLNDQDINETPVVRFVNKILIDAIESQSSDIHFEPFEKICRLRYRQDGVLNEIINAPKKLLNPVVARLKVMANLDITERRIPQDGRFRLLLAKQKAIDIRLSTCPTLQGEKVVMRILDPMTSHLEIKHLGMHAAQERNFCRAIEKPQGMILVTGPTGSGKTVTLYTALQQLNSIEKNISTVEDPVEIFVHGINQVQVHNKVGLNFQSALRSFLRQDPDIIMVGEIRDLETAEIAIKAAQTGHLVLSTLHTNSAPLTIARLVSMGIKPYNIASALTLVVAQRLARRLCEHCKKPVKDIDDALRAFDQVPETHNHTLFEAVGCSYCNHGYKGRIGIFEVLPVCNALKAIILEGANAIDIEHFARAQKIPGLQAAGLSLALSGVTSLSEIKRVTL